MARKDREIKAWITINGNHIPIYEGDTKDDAVRRAITGKNPHRKPKNLEDIPTNKLTSEQKKEIAQKASG